MLCPRDKRFIGGLDFHWSNFYEFYAKSWKWFLLTRTMLRYIRAVNIISIAWFKTEVSLADQWEMVIIGTVSVISPLAFQSKNSESNSKASLYSESITSGPISGHFRFNLWWLPVGKWKSNNLRVNFDLSYHFSFFLILKTIFWNDFWYSNLTKKSSSTPKSQLCRFSWI